jgi:hypothetical protein
MEVRFQKGWVKYLIPGISVTALVATLIFLGLITITTPKTQAVLIAARDLAPGVSLQAGDLREVQLPLGELSSNYLTHLNHGWVLNQAVSKGQLIPKGSLSQSQDSLIPIRLNNLRPIPKTISVGDSVDVWASTPSQLTKSTPEPVAFHAVITLIEANNSMAQNTTNVELRVSGDFLESLLAAVDSNCQISLILHETAADIE